MIKGLFALTTGTFLCILLSACNYSQPNKDIKGSVFVVTKGAGAYKLALVKVYFCPMDQTKDAIGTLQQAYSDQVAQQKANCDRIQKECVLLSADRNAANAALEKQMQIDSNIKNKYNSLRSLIVSVFNKTEYRKSLWKEGIYTIMEVRNDQTQDDQIPDVGSQLDGGSLLYKYDSEGMSTSFFNIETKQEHDERVQTLGQLNSSMSAVILQENELQEAQTAIESKLENKQDEFKRAVDALSNVPSVIAGQANTLSTSAKYTAVTDADGHFTVSIPKADTFIIVAASEREVGPGNTEHYFWVVPFSANDANTSNIELDNDNELLTGSDGAKLLQFFPPDISAYKANVPPL